MLTYTSQSEAFRTQGQAGWRAFDVDAGYAVGAGSIGGVTNAGVADLTFPAGSQPAAHLATVHPQSFHVRRAWWVAGLVSFHH